MIRGLSGDQVLFLESRSDVRVRWGPGEPRSRLRTWVRGAALDGPRDSRFLSDPERAALGPWVGGGSPAAKRTGEGLPATEAADPIGPIDDPWSSLDPRCRAVVRGIAFAQQVWIVQPGRPPCRDRREGARVRVTVTAPGNSSTAEATVDAVRRPGRSLDLGALVGWASSRALQRLDAVPAGSGSTTAVFAPGVGGIVVHELVGHALEGDVVSSRASRLIAAGLHFNSAAVQVLDDPRRARAAWTIDDEANAAGPTPLIRDGRVIGALHDRRSAGDCNTTSTGHARRSSYLDPVRPRMGCTFLGNGPDDADGIVRGTRDGIYVRRLETASVDAGSGVASFRVTDADRIRDGCIDAPLLPFVLTVALDDTLSTLDAVASDLAFDTCVGSCIKDGQPLPTSVGAPTFRIGVVRVYTSKSSN